MSQVRSPAQAAISNQRIKEDIMHPDIIAALVGQHRAELTAQAMNSRLAREARKARRAARTTPGAVWRGWARPIPNQARAR